MYYQLFKHVLLGPGLIFVTWLLLDRQRRRTRYGPN